MIRTLIVEDEPIAARAHAAYLDRLPGFEVVGVAQTGLEADRALSGGEVDLVLLDLNLPDVPGLELLRRARAAGSTVDVIVVSSARDADVIRSAVSQGAVHYLIKPFAYAALKEKLLGYKAFRDEVTGDRSVDQGAVDRALAVLRTPLGGSLPKGMTPETLDLVTRSLRERGETSATEIAGSLGISRITAGRYLGYLVEAGVARRGHRYGQVGRPESRYRLADRDPLPPGFGGRDSA